MRGRCVLILSEGKASTKDFLRFNLKSLVVKESADIVFVWYGEGESEGEPRPFEVLMDSTYAFDEIQDEWNVYYSRVIENQLDVSHFAFVHATTIGRGNKTLVNGPKVV